MPLGCALRGGELVRGTPASQAARRQGPGPGLDVSRGHCAGRPRPRGRGGAPQSVWASQRPHEADAVAPSDSGGRAPSPGGAVRLRPRCAHGAPCAPRRTPAPPAPPQPRPTYVIDDLVRALQVRGGVRDAAELEERGQRSVSARAPFTGPFPERRCRPPGTRQPGLATGRPGPFLRGTQCWLHKGPTPVWTCGADARTCYRAQLA